VEIPEPKAGLVIQYAYLWFDEARQGREEGVKGRPCVITHTLNKDERTFVFVAPITHTPQSENAVDMPPATGQRLGLDDAPSWVVTSEVNRFEWPGYDLQPISRDKPQIAYGFLPRNLTRQIRSQVREHARERTISRDLSRDREF
jgi:hypothetical protein